MLLGWFEVTGVALRFVEGVNRPQTALWSRERPAFLSRLPVQVSPSDFVWLPLLYYLLLSLVLSGHCTPAGKAATKEPPQAPQAGPASCSYLPRWKASHLLLQKLLPIDLGLSPSV